MLWLCDNLIRRVEGLASLASLQEMNLAGNPVEVVGDVLHANVTLETLNLAGTCIGSFKQV